ncbi:SRPBCC family protein [Methylobacillus gramineus]|uniref:SRPBCC family protein n=1 Tax=Methylobacillus gramineus TaxID=755169 RepID=UPI001CFFC267|nr:SRPBCC family protein [Methylobacillus gramineus]MCB5183674.1 SRPBCC family protein [Methylobacillus gramineus]
MRLLIAVLSIAIAAPAFAHGPTPRKTDEAVTVKATADAVWAKVSEPCGIAKWHPEVKACEKVDDKTTNITLKNGGKIQQQVDELDTANKTISYRLGGEIALEALPVSSLTGRIKVDADGSNAKVSWMARFYRFDTGNEPPEGQDDETAQNAVDGFIKAGLAALESGK